MQTALAPSNADEPTLRDLIAARSYFSMDSRDGLMLEAVPLHVIAEAVGTPTWVLSAGHVRERLQIFGSALSAAGLSATIHYAVKANDHLAVLRIVAEAGAGADVVSGGELRRALVAGIPAERVVFSGVGKAVWELRAALDAGVGQINVESGEELGMLSEIAVGMGVVAGVALRINPDVDAGTHAKITTGRAENKFGIAFEDAARLYAHAAALPGVKPVGIALHIGSQILSTLPYRAAYARAAALVATLRDAGHDVEVVDCGGGLGIPYRNEPSASAAAMAGAMAGAFGGLNVRLAIEPGRWVVGGAGVLLASVVLQKQTAQRRFVVLDAAMNDLLRPAMYDAWHGVVPLDPARLDAAVSAADVVGPVCESGDTFARDRLLPDLPPQTRVAILDAGAYGSVMSSRYNARPLAAQALVDGERWAVIRPRQDVEAMWADEVVPGWLSAEPG